MSILPTECVSESEPAHISCCDDHLVKALLGVHPLQPGRHVVTVDVSGVGSDPQFGGKDSAGTYIERREDWHLVHYAMIPPRRIDQLDFDPPWVAIVHPPDGLCSNDRVGHCRSL